MTDGVVPGGGALPAHFPAPPQQVPPRADWDANKVTLLLLELSRQLQQLNDQLDQFETDAVEKAEELNQAWLKAFINAEGPQYLRKAIADRDTHEQRLAAELAKVMVRGQKRKIEVLRERIGVGRTVASSLRAELELERAR
ncbi:hypothetical protein SEA_LITTLELAF_68 [Mycobacterium phage LittleLaf]|uniref:Uncharacterized protein n=3 Tax=Marvinvirus TaxID=1982091 RepID=A0A385UDJ4_9CAUD|nr:hypothetical protein SEA_GATTACA_66 [Mycobacterium phage Gattaca]AYB69872.1 hypothetical protein SEA_LITTLELAF_68 [Mycobacterium phage LittleLaf]QAX93118.1 hypothetical protein SEA_REDRAIDER77_67 [Mycobacterium phage RedRaider77]